jgi:hypothetical protein
MLLGSKVVLGLALLTIGAFITMVQARRPVLPIVRCSSTRLENNERDGDSSGKWQLPNADGRGLHPTAYEYDEALSA